MLLYVTDCCSVVIYRKHKFIDIFIDIDRSKWYRDHVHRNCSSLHERGLCALFLSASSNWWH